MYIDCVEVGCRESASRICLSAGKDVSLLEEIRRGRDWIEREREREEKESRFSSSLVVVVVQEEDFEEALKKKEEKKKKKTTFSW